MVWILGIFKDEEAGINPKKLAGILGMERSHIGYYLKRMTEEGLLRSAVRDAIAIYQITRKGQDLLDWYQKRGSKLPICRAENIRFKAEVLLMPIIPVDWKKVELNNWAQYNGVIDTIKVKLNNGKKPTIEFLPSPIEGDNPWKLYGILIYECLQAAIEMYSRFGIKVGMMQLSTRSEWLVYDPIARAFTKYHGQVTYEGRGKVNASSPRCIGEFEFHDPRALYDYLEMPRRVRNIEKILKEHLNHCPALNSR